MSASLFVSGRQTETLIKSSASLVILTNLLRYKKTANAVMKYFYRIFRISDVEVLISYLFLPPKLELTKKRGFEFNAKQVRSMLN